MHTSADGMSGGWDDDPFGDSAGPAAAHHDVTCLGCGCACDDIDVVVRGGRLLHAQRACALGRAWFGDGSVPRRALSGGREVGVAAAALDAARLLAGARHGALVYLAPGLSCEAQRQGAAVADVLRAALDNVSSATVLDGVLAAQRRGRAGATLGEVRNRADLVVDWGVDPAERYPRYEERYAPRRAGRAVIAVDVGDHHGPADAESRLVLDPAREADALSLMREATKHFDPAAAAGDRDADGGPPWAREARALAARLAAAHYAVVVHDAEPPDEDDDGGGAAAAGARAEGLIALTQALNARTRCALSTLRAGGNRNGAESVMTAQAGFPLAVDFARGHPRYRPHDGALPLLERGEVDAALVLGALALVPTRVRHALARVPCAVVGPRASEAPFEVAVAIDTGVAGIHESGLALRMDDVPLPLRPPLRAAGPSAYEVAREILKQVRIVHSASRTPGGPDAQSAVRNAKSEVSPE
jgi:formylmethanofuran dehydrogenase subunit B